MLRAGKFGVDDGARRSGAELVDEQPRALHEHECVEIAVRDEERRRVLRVAGER